MAATSEHIGALIHAFIEGVDLQISDSPDDENPTLVNVLYVDTRNPHHITIGLDNGQMFNVTITAGRRQ